MFHLRQAEGTGVIPYRCGEFEAKLAIQNGYGLKQADFFEELKQDYVEYRFKMGRKFAFRPPRTIVIGPPEPFAELLTLHEVSHAICKHKAFKTDVERLKMEVQAWEEARKLAAHYGIEMEEEIVQRELDTYRDWLHQKSLCPQCGLTRYQTADGLYHCPLCENSENDKK